MHGWNSSSPPARGTQVQHRAHYQDRQSVVAVLGAVNDGDVIVLKITGELVDGTSFEGEDVIVIIKK